VQSRRKHPIRLTCEAIIAGYVDGYGSAAGGIGSLLLGAHNAAGELVYIGHVGTGFTAKARRELRAKLDELACPDPSFAAAPPRAVAHQATWCRPQLVGDVFYREFTDRLRHPSWRGLRTDKLPHQVSLPGEH
jgi:bifunctional non-homologous end joining protein LigD